MCIRDRPLVERFLDAQQEVTFYEAWIASESKEMAESYRRLVRGVKDATGELILEAWKTDPRPMPGNAVEEDEHPDVSELADEFLNDVRSHLSRNPFNKAPSVGEISNRPKPKPRRLTEGENL